MQKEEGTSIAISAIAGHQWRGKDFMTKHTVPRTTQLGGKKIEKERDNNTKEIEEG